MTVIAIDASNFEHLKAKNGRSRRSRSLCLRGVPSEMRAEVGEHRKRLFAALPGSYYKAVKPYHSANPVDLRLDKGDIIEVLYVGDEGFLEGRVRDKIGWFPNSCVQNLVEQKGGKSGQTREGGLFGSKKMTRREGIPREVKMKRSKKGYGFVIRGSMQPVPNFIPTPEFPALQYFDKVDKGGAADKLGLRPGDFILEFNGEDVRGITHADMVEKIKNCREGFTLKVMTPPRDQDLLNGGTLPSRNYVAPRPPLRDANTSLSLGRIRSPSVEQISRQPPHNPVRVPPVGILKHSNRASQPALQSLFDPSENCPESSAHPQNWSREISQSATDLTYQKPVPQNSFLNGSVQSLNINPSPVSSTRSDQSTGSSQSNHKTHSSAVQSYHEKRSQTGQSYHEKRNSVVHDDDEEAAVEKIRGGPIPDIKPSLATSTQTHKPVIKSKSKDQTDSSQTNSLKSTFYNLNKQKKPAPPPPPKKKAPVVPQKKPVEEVPDLSVNLRISDSVLASQTSEERSPDLDMRASSFKPRPLSKLSSSQPSLQNAQIDDSVKSNQFVPPHANVTVVKDDYPEIPSPDYSNSECGENSDEEDLDVEVTELPVIQVGLNSQPEKSTKKESSEPREDPCQIPRPSKLHSPGHVEPHDKGFADISEDVKPSPLSSPRELQASSSEVDVRLRNPQNFSTEPPKRPMSTFGNSEYSAVKSFELRRPNSVAVIPGSESGSGDRKQPPPVPPKTSSRISIPESTITSPSREKLHEELLSGVKTKSKASSDERYYINAIESSLNHRSEMRTMTYHPPVNSTAAQKPPNSFGKSQNPGEDDVDSLINRFTVPPPPPSLAPDNDLASAVKTNSSHQFPSDQGYESASASPDSSRSEKQASLAVFTRQNPGSSAATPRKSLNELLLSQSDLEKSQDTSDIPSSSDLKSSFAKEILAKSMHPKSDRLLKLMEQHAKEENNNDPPQSGTLPIKLQSFKPRYTIPQHAKPVLIPADDSPRRHNQSDLDTSHQRSSSQSSPVKHIASELPSPVIQSDSPTNIQPQPSSKPADDWNVSDVCDWLVSIGMGEYVGSFQSNAIAGAHLKLLEKSDLTELGVKPLGHKITIEKAIKKLP